MPSKPAAGETRIEHVQCEMESQRVILSANDDHQSQPAMVSLCPFQNLPLGLELGY